MRARLTEEQCVPGAILQHEDGSLYIVDKTEGDLILVHTVIECDDIYKRDHWKGLRRDVITRYPMTKLGMVSDV